MMNSDEIISIYETVSEITDLMLIAAKSQDWEKLSSLESKCAQQISSLQQGEFAAVLSEQTREKKVQLIKKILADDREIRDITEPWMAQVAALIKSSGTTRKLSNTYHNARLF